MSRTDYTWSTAKPPKVDVYVTRINESKVQSIRYWDGERWFDIGVRGGVPFVWPKGAGVRCPDWARYPAHKDLLRLRSITDQAAIQWGTPFKVYDEKEVLAYLVKIAVLPADWRTAFQDAMRAAAKGGAA